MSVVYYTEEGLQKLVDEIRQLESIERPKISRQIAEARDKGDLSENAEYDAAKEAQGLLEAKISKLKDKLANARIINESQLDSSKVTILSTVKVLNQNMKKEFTYTIVPENEANIKEFKISIDSPIGKGLLGKKVGEIAEITVPNGVMKFEILNISL
jgi:transcription elongation factor GreA